MTHFLKKIILIFLISLFYSTYSFSKNNNLSFSDKNISSYFLGIISINENNASQAYNFFKKIQPPQDQHINFNIQFLRSLVLVDKFDKSFNYVESLNPEARDFNEANLLMALNYFIKHDNKNAEKYFKRVHKNSENNFYFENYLSSFLYSILKASEGNKADSLRILETIPDEFYNLKKIQEALLHCHFDSPITFSLYSSLVEDNNKSFSRYNFFLVNYLLHKNDIKLAKDLIKKARNNFESNILIRQTYNYIQNKDYESVKKSFNCKNSKDLFAEFFYIIANLYSSEQNYILSNFYLKTSLFLNSNFSSNLSLLAENYFYQKNYKNSRKIYNLIKKNGDVYSWFAAKKIAILIATIDDKEKSIKFLKKEIRKISNPSFHHYYDLAVFLKSNKNYKEAVKYFSLALNELENENYLIPDILDGRGSSYERLGMWEEAEKDLKESLKISPDQPFVLNYLAYSWLEKKINIDQAIQMLTKANELYQDNGYIIDSLGWGFYLSNDYVKAKKYMRRAVELMPFDPVINDHYGDILWKLDEKIQARYFWKHALNFEDEDKEFIDAVNKKVIFGLPNHL